MSLLALPNELLQHIARFLPCSSLLQLIRVNHQVYNACYDPLTFGDIAHNAFSNTPGAIDRLLDLYKQPERVGLALEQLSWPEGERLLEKSSFEDTIRVAHAVEQLIKLSTLKPSAWLTATTSGMAEWLPHLLALHHPAAWCLEPDMFLLPHGQLGQLNTNATSSFLMNRWLSRSADQARDKLASTKLQAVHFVNFSFILNYTTLQRLGSTNTPNDVVDLFVGHFGPNGIDIQPLDGTQDLIENVIQRLSERVPGYGTFKRDFSLIQASAVLPLLLIAIATSSHALRQRFLPIPANIPFAKFMDIPNVFRNSAELFTTCHYQAMTTPEFLSGRWLGYYSDHRWFGINRMVRIDPPMQCIQVFAYEPTEEARTRLRIKAVIDRETRGYDACGDFRLSGRVREDGLVSVAKQYLGSGDSWTWTGRITPFGIIGVWGDHSFGGYFWIFKEEWMSS